MILRVWVISIHSRGETLKMSETPVMLLAGVKGAHALVSFPLVEVAVREYQAEPPVHDLPHQGDRMNLILQASRPHARLPETREGSATWSHSRREQSIWRPAKPARRMALPIKVMALGRGSRHTSTRLPGTDSADKRIGQLESRPAIDVSPRASRRHPGDVYGTACLRIVGIYSF
jgi:hypothetical protein